MEHDTFELPESLRYVSQKEITYRCWIHANKMSEEGHHVTTNVLLAAMEEIERLRGILGSAMGEIEKLSCVIDIAKQVCGKANCNCPGAPRMKAAIGHLETP